MDDGIVVNKAVPNYIQFFPRYAEFKEDSTSFSSESVAYRIAEEVTNGWGFRTPGSMQSADSLIH